jgi:signal transduction histidine kinase
MTVMPMATMMPMTPMADRPAGRLRRLVGSIRFRVTALATLAVLAVLVVAGVVLVIAQRRFLTQNVDDRLAQRADDIAALVDSRPTRPLPGSSDDEIFAQVVSEDGQVIAASPVIAGEPPLAGAPAAGRRESLRTIDELPIDDDPFRVLSRRADGPDGSVVIHVAGSVDDVSESVALLASTLTIVVPLLAVVLAALVWWLVGRTLRPVDEIRAEVADIGGSDLDRRVPVPGSGDEVARLADTMNAMLDRVEQASLRQQRFVADASHELRSPLTRIRSEIEVDLAHPERADPLATHRSALEETAALQRLVEDLLHLARSDAGATRAGDEPVDLDDIVLRHARHLRSAGGVTVDISGVTAAQVRGDRDQLDRAVGNVSDNAARHGAGRVAFTLAERDGRARLSISDDGPGIPADARERVFDRFARLDDARASGSGGTGLGLAIARDVVERHGGTIAIDPDHRPGTRFVITLPLSPHDP